MSTKIKRRWINLDYSDSDNALRAQDIPFNESVSITSKIDTLSASLSSVVGPSSSTDEAIVRFDSTTGRLVQNSLVTISDSGNITLSGTVDGRDISVDGTKLDTIETSADVTDTANVSAALTNTLSITTAVTADYILIQDASDSYKLKKVLVSDVSGGGGNVTGSDSSTDNAIVRFDSTTGKLIQNSNVTITDAGNIVLSGTVDGRDISVDGIKLDTIETSADITDTSNVSAALNNTLVAVTAANEDYVLIQDASDSFSLRKALKSDFSGGAVTGGDVSSSVSASFNNEVVVFDGTGGKTIKQSGMYIDSTSLTGSIINFDDFNVAPPTSALVTGDLYILNNGTNVSLNYYDGSNLKSMYIINYVTIPIRLTADSEDNALVSSIVTFRMPHAMTLTNVRANCSTAPTGSGIIIDINESGSSILSTKLTIDATEETSTTAATPVVISDTSLADDAKITIDFDAVGSTTPGKGTIVWLIGYRT